MLHKPSARDAQVFFDDADVDERHEYENHPRFSAEAPWDRDPRDLPRRQWVYGKNYLLGAVSLLIADGGVGKTNLALTEAVAIATGRNLIGERTKWSCGERVLFWNGEETRLEIERRVHAVCQHYNVPPRELIPKNAGGGGLLIASGLDFPIRIASAGPRGIITDDANIEAIVEFIQANSIDVIIIDPFVATHAVSENDNTAINAVVGVWKRLAAELNVCVLLVHHTRKPVQGGTAENSVGDARGASALIDAVRAARVLNQMTEAEGERAGVENRRDYFRCENGKANYARRPETATWYRFTDITLPNAACDDDDFDEPGDNVGVVMPWRFPQPFDNVTTDHMNQVRERVRVGNYRVDAQSPDWIGLAVAEVLDLDPEDDKARIKAILKAWFATGALRTVKRKDRKGMLRSFVEPGAWSQP